MSGWIKLHRGMTKWEWYSDANTCRVFLHCLLKANHTEKSWRGISINRGQFLSSFDSIAADLKLTRQKVRTSINKLKSTNELTISSSAQSTMFTVVKYDQYQSSTDESTIEQPMDNQQITNDQPTINQQVTTTKNVKKEKNVNKDTIDFSLFDMCTAEQIEEIKRIRRKNNTGKAGTFTNRIIKSAAKQFNLSIEKGWTVEEILTKWEEKGWRTIEAEYLEVRFPSHTNLDLQFSEQPKTKEQNRNEVRKKLMDPKDTNW